MNTTKKVSIRLNNTYRLLFTDFQLVSVTLQYVINVALTVLIAQIKPLCYSYSSSVCFVFCITVKISYFCHFKMYFYWRVFIIITLTFLYSQQLLRTLGTFYSSYMILGLSYKGKIQKTLLGFYKYSFVIMFINV